jgi:hypothetical protein
MKPNKRARWPMPKKARHRVGDVLIVQLKPAQNIPTVWVGEVISLSESTYSLKCLSYEAKTPIKVPFLFEPCLTKIHRNELNSVIKTIKILYNR